MPKAIDIGEVRHVAELARLELSDTELQRMTRDLGSILDYVQKLDELDVSEVQATTHAVELPTRLRDDAVQPSLDVDAGLRGAPERLGDGFGVPKIIE